MQIVMEKGKEKKKKRQSSHPNWRRASPCRWPGPTGTEHPCCFSSPVPTCGSSRFGENLTFWRWGFAYFCLQRASWRGAAPPALGASGLAPSTCSDLEKEVTGTCRQEPLTYIKKVYSRESVYISINISCIYINKYMEKKRMYNTNAT